MLLITCPACGCRVQAADALEGQRVRCFGCGHRFVAGDSSPPPRREEPSLPRLSAEEKGADGERGPFCPGCGRRIGWTEPRCPYCGEELEPESDFRRWHSVDLIRRDYEPHRGQLLAALGNLSMMVGGLSLCMLGFGAVLSIPLGALVWLMANRDLERMRDGRMDPRGRARTETGRTGGVAGVVLGSIFAAFYVFLYLVK